MCSGTHVKSRQVTGRGRGREEIVGVAFLNAGDRMACLNPPKGLLGLYKGGRKQGVETLPLGSSEEVPGSPPGLSQSTQF